MRFLGFLLVFPLAAPAQIVPGRFIVELDLPSAIEFSKSSRSADAIRDHSARLRLQHEQLRGLIESRRGRVRGTVDTVANAIIVEEATEAELQTLPGLRRVIPVRYLELNLDRITPLMNFTAAWEKAGGLSRAGAGAKIAILDTGIDPHHAGFQDPTLTMPEGFPKVSPQENSTLTNSKIIAARSYNGTAADGNGHGTGVAMAAAGVRHQGPRGLISGAAPKAWLGNYRVSEGATDLIPTDNVLRALDDAVKDGMDVINMSFGAPGLSRSADEILTSSIDKAFAAGVIVVVASGNQGPDAVTVSDVGSAATAITVGATENDRIPTRPQVILLPSTRFNAAAAANSEEAPTVRGKLVDVEKLDRTGLACDPLPADSIKDRIAVIQRGECTFESKVQNAQAAGAIGAVVYNNVAARELVTMLIESRTIPSLFLIRTDGQSIKDTLAADSELEAVLFFSFNIPENPNAIVPFSSRGPTVDLAIKPDLLAIGGNVITAVNGTTAGDPDTSGYVVADGTSLSSPIVAGAAAVLKAARPGLTAPQYRSLIVNTASPFPKDAALEVQRTGTGIMNFPAILDANLAFGLTSVSFGEYRGQQAVSREFEITNVGVGPENLTLSIASINSIKPSITPGTLTIGSKASAKLTLNWPAGAAPPGEYQGFVEFSNAERVLARVPYWLAVRSNEAKAISVARAPSRGAPGSVQEVYFRVVEGAGLILLEPQPEVTVTSGGGSLVLLRLFGADLPGVYLARLRLGITEEINVFKIKAGTLEREIRIRAGF
jgi:subtilisin family serine protease